MQKSEQINELAAAFVKAQAHVEGAKKDSVNPFYKSKYADLSSVWDAVRTALQDNDLAVSQMPDESTTGQPALCTMLIHKSGQWISSVYPLAVAKPDAQSFGSAISYARRYALAALLGVLSEDDDGEHASKPPKPPTTAPTKPQEAQTPVQAPQTQTATITPENWLKEALARIPGMSREVLDNFTEKQADRLARVRTLHPDLHGQVIKAIGKRQEELF